MSCLSRVQNKHFQPQENQSYEVDKLDEDKIVDAYFNHIQRRTYYHGTSKTSAKDIYCHGMKIAHKQKGSTDLLKKKFGLDDKASSIHHYVMGRVSAARYAKQYRHPKIVRIVIPQEIKLEKDPEGYSSDEMRTKADIPYHLVLPLKPHKLSTEDVVKIVRSLQLPSLKNHEDCLKRLRDRIRNEILENHRSDKSVLSRVEDFSSMEAQRHQKTMELMHLQGIDIGALKEGDVISVPV